MSKITDVWFDLSPAEVVERPFEPFDWWQEGVDEEDRAFAIGCLLVVHPLGDFEDHPRVQAALQATMANLLNLVGKYWILSPGWEEEMDRIVAPIRITVEFGFITTDPGGGDFAIYRLYAEEELLDERKVGW